MGVAAFGRWADSPNLARRLSAHPLNGRRWSRGYRGDTPLPRRQSAEKAAAARRRPGSRAAAPALDVLADGGGGWVFTAADRAQTREWYGGYLSDPFDPRPDSPAKRYPATSA